jgi:hypothetical protein
MNMLGFVTPKIEGYQTGIDLFPVTSDRGSQGKKPIVFNDTNFLIFGLPKLDQRYTWEALQRVIRQSSVPCWNAVLCDEISELDYEKITPPRNHFLYKAGYWPMDDILADSPASELDTLIGTGLDTENEGFLLRLCFTVYVLFEQLMVDVSSRSNIIRAEIELTQSELSCDHWQPYNLFMSQLANNSIASEISVS